MNRINIRVEDNELDIIIAALDYAEFTRGSDTARKPIAAVHQKMREARAFSRAATATGNAYRETAN